MATNVKNNSALVLHSGGQDSTTCLAWALKKFKDVRVISFDYGQRHKRELTSAKKITDKLNLNFKVLKIDLFSQITSNSLINHNAKISAGDEKNLPSTFVDGRNIIFLTTAAIYAKQLGIPNIITGVCQTDYSGYPDCRPEYISAYETMANLATKEGVEGEKRLKIQIGRASCRERV